MSFAPIIPTGGNAGWAFLQRTREQQQEAFDQSGPVARDTEYFEQNIGKVTKAEDLMKDYRLLKVALGAFGLDEDINSKFFVRKVLEEGTLAEDALSNKMSDKRYKAMAQAFGFDLTPPRTQVSTFGEKITSMFKERQFEMAVGEQDPNMRLVMGFERELANATKSGSEDAMWFNVMATQPLRKVFEGAFNLPASFGMINVDQQLETFKSKAEAIFGDASAKQFMQDPGKREELTRMFLVRADLQSASTGMSGGSVALSLLQSMPQPGSLFG